MTQDQELFYTMLPQAFHVGMLLEPSQVGRSGYYTITRIDRVTAGLPGTDMYCVYGVLAEAPRPPRRSAKFKASA